MIRFSKLKSLFITIVLSGLCSLTFAQFSGGGRIGANLSNLRGSSIKNNKMLVGYNIGGFVNYSLEDVLSGDIADIMSVQAELSIQTKGTQAEYHYVDPETTYYDIKQNFTYVQVPVLAKFTFGDPRSIRYFAEGGFFGAALFGLTVDGEKSRDDDNDTGTDPRKYREEYSGFDMGLVVGGGIIMPFGGIRSPWSAFFNARYSLGLKNIGEFKDKTIDIPEDHLQDIKTSTISLLAGVAYKF